MYTTWQLLGTGPLCSHYVAHGRNEPSVPIMRKYLCQPRSVPLIGPVEKVNPGTSNHQFFEDPHCTLRMNAPPLLATFRPGDCREHQDLERHIPLRYPLACSTCLLDENSVCSRICERPPLELGHPCQRAIGSPKYDLDPLHYRSFCAIKSMSAELVLPTSSNKQFKPVIMPTGRPL